jgi:hypothetical protein
LHPGREYADRVIHLRIVSPPDGTEHVLEVLECRDSVINVALGSPSGVLEDDHAEPPLARAER